MAAVFAHTKKALLTADDFAGVFLPVLGLDTCTTDPKSKVNIAVVYHYLGLRLPAEVAEAQFFARKMASIRGDLIALRMTPSTTPIFEIDTSSIESAWSMEKGSMRTELLRGQLRRFLIPIKNDIVVKCDEAIGQSVSMAISSLLADPRLQFASGTVITGESQMAILSAMTNGLLQIPVCKEYIQGFIRNSRSLMACDPRTSLTPSAVFQLLHCTPDLFSDDHRPPVKDEDTPFSYFKDFFSAFGSSRDTLPRFLWLSCEDDHPLLHTARYFIFEWLAIHFLGKAHELAILGAFTQKFNEQLKALERLLDEVVETREWSTGEVEFRNVPLLLSIGECLPHPYHTLYKPSLPHGVDKGLSEALKVCNRVNREAVDAWVVSIQPLSLCVKALAIGYVLSAPKEYYCNPDMFFSANTLLRYRARCEPQRITVTLDDSRVITMMIQPILEWIKKMYKNHCYMASRVKGTELQDVICRTVGDEDGVTVMTRINKRRHGGGEGCSKCCRLVAEKLRLEADVRALLPDETKKKLPLYASIQETTCLYPDMKEMYVSLAAAQEVFHPVTKLDTGVVKTAWLMRFIAENFFKIPANSRVPVGSPIMTNCLTLEGVAKACNAEFRKIFKCDIQQGAWMRLVAEWKLADPQFVFVRVSQKTKYVGLRKAGTLIPSHVEKYLELNGGGPPSAYGFTEEGGDGEEEEEIRSVIPGDPRFSTTLGSVDEDDDRGFEESDRETEYGVFGGSVGAGSHQTAGGGGGGGGGSEDISVQDIFSRRDGGYPIPSSVSSRSKKQPRVSSPSAAPPPLRPLPVPPVDVEPDFSGRSKAAMRQIEKAITGAVKSIPIVPTEAAGACPVIDVFVEAFPCLDKEHLSKMIPPTVCSPQSCFVLNKGAFRHFLQSSVLSTERYRAWMLRLLAAAKYTTLPEKIQRPNCVEAWCGNPFHLTGRLTV